MSDTAASAASGTTARRATRVHVRWMIRRDMPEVNDIEQHGVADPWSDADIRRRLRQRNCIGMVAEYGERAVGYMIYELHKGELRIPKIAVHPDFRRTGVGRQMVHKLIGKLGSHRRTRVTLAVRETNLTAQLFFRAMDFRAVRVARGYYEGGDESAYVMQFRIEGDDGWELGGEG